MRQPILILVALVVALWTAHAEAQRVTRVIDGDTLVIEGIGTVRLIGVDTPETVDPRRPVQRFGKEASAFTRQQAEGRTVRLEYDGPRFDRYRRTLAYVYLSDGSLLNAEIIRQGYGHAYTQFPFRLLEQFRAYEREAREAGRGLWADDERRTAAAAQEACVNINTADATALQRIIHIGPERAQQIIALRRQRPFRSVNELTRVKGIAAARLRDILAQGVACVG